MKDSRTDTRPGFVDFTRYMLGRLPESAFIETDEGEPGRSNTRRWEATWTTQRGLWHLTFRPTPHVEIRGPGFSLQLGDAQAGIVVAFLELAGAIDRLIHMEDGKIVSVPPPIPPTPLRPDTSKG